MPLYRAELQPKKIVQPSALIHDVSQVLYLPFDYDDGSYARDRSGRALHGTIYGATLTAGKIGMGRKFDGTDDYVKIPKRVTQAVDNWTLAAWIYPTKIPQAGHAVFVGDDSAGYGFGIGTWETTNRIGGLFGGVAWLDSGYVVEANKWYHVVMTRRDGTTYFYINGVQAPNTFTQTPYAPYDLTTIGTSILPDHVSIYKPFEGIIDEVRISIRALSQGEIRMLMYRRW